jgi:hypothetical protein
MAPPPESLDPLRVRRPVLSERGIELTHPRKIRTL